MPRERVNSSSIASVGYAADQRLLDVEFVKGSVYRYFDVPSDAHGALMAAESLGAHFNRHIRGCYRYALVGTEPR